MDNRKSRKSPFGHSYILINKLALTVLVFLFVFAPWAPVLAVETIAEPALTQVTVPNPTTAPEGESQASDNTTLSPVPGEEVQSPDTTTPVPEEATSEEEEMALASEDETEIVDHYRNNFDLKKFAQVEESSGSLQFEIPMTVPTGRNGLTPDISFQYSSKNVQEASIIAPGWNVNIPYIERVNKKGLNTMFTDNYFNSSLSGELTTSNGKDFFAKVEDGNFIKYTFLNNTWIATDKAGKIYKFGTNSESVQKDPDDESNRKVKWFVTEIRDTNNNFIRFEYLDSNNNFGQTYPKKIYYTGNGTTDGIFEVEFLYQDNPHSYQKSNLGFSVETKSVLQQIIIKKVNIPVRKYQLEFSLPLYRKVFLLKKITEVGISESGVETALPPYEFSYQDSDTPGWEETNEWELPFPLVSTVPSGAAFPSAQFAEVNGDGLPDIIRSFTQNKVVLGNEVYLNTGKGWELETTPKWELPIIFYVHGDNQGYRVVDVNGDGLDDILKSNESLREAYINDGSNWIYSPEWSPTVLFNQTGGAEFGVRIVDINGDGLVDILRSQVGSKENRAYLNTGSGWAASTSWLPPVEFIDNQKNDDTGYLDVDLNADGLPDFIRAFKTRKQHFIQQVISKGNANWSIDNNLPGMGSDIAFIDNLKDLGFRTADVNGDGQTDVLRFLTDGGIQHKENYIDLGNLWSELPGWFNPLPFIDRNGGQDKGTRFVDFNGDGMVDLIRKESISSETEAHVNKSKKVDLLSSIKYPTGGTTSVEYKTGQQYKDSSGNLLNPKVPFIIFTVSKITNKDNGKIIESNYKYQDGFFYNGNGNIFERKFAGFGQVSKTDSVGNVTKTFFHQGNTTNGALGEFDDHISKAGKPYRVEQYNNAGNLYALSVNKWDKQNLGTNRDFIKLVRETSLQYDGNSTHADTATDYLYNNGNGNLIQKINHGLVIANTDGSFTDTGTDKSTEIFSYATNSTKNILRLPSAHTVYNQNIVKIKESKTYYDNGPLKFVANGNETKAEQWVSGSTYINTQKTYNAHGLVTSEIDPRGKVTSYSYDSYNLYPTTIINPLLHTTTYVYDYANGKPKQVTDVNNFVYQTNYDGLGRILAEKIPDETAPYTPIIKTNYQYTDILGNMSVKKTDYLSSTNSVDTYQYFDGFGRLIQERKELENLSSANFSVKDIVYNKLGLVEKETVPYIGSNGAKTNPSTIPTHYTSYTYDVLGRPLAITNTLGATSYIYDDLKTEVIDAKGKMKRFYKDVRGNLSKAEEINFGSTYTTNYAWNLIGSLTKITDALGNVRNFTYDALGRRLTAEDLHASTDTTFGIWRFTYDNAGNVTRTINPNNQTTNYTYNDLGQILTEDFTGITGNEIVYTYNTCSKGKGRVCSVFVAGTGSVNYNYGPNDQILSESKYLNALTYVTAFTYDRQGNQTKIVYPDLSEVLYTYNTAGLLEKIERKESGGVLSSVVSNFDYTPMYQIKTKSFANFVNTTFTYDANKQFRLSKIFTQNNVPAKLQDLNYTYDPVGNITKIVDSSITDTAKTVNYVYDDLHRITSVNSTGAVSGTNYYQTFGYNPIGNITSNSLGVYVYSGTNYANPHAVTSIAGVGSTYDNNGNLLSDGTLTNTWNYKNQLTSVLKAGITSTYKFDHEGNRTSETVGTTTTTFPNKYYNVTNKGKKTKNIYAGEELVATIETVGSVTTPYYTHSDHLGSPNIITGGNGTRSETLDYFPFGELRLNVKTGNFDSSRKYIGEEFDDSTGLNYLNARYYNSKQGRFLSQDPAFLDIGASTFEKDYSRTLQQHLMNPQALNSYSYANNNPVTLKDPKGEILPLLIGVWAIAEIGLSAYDIYSTAGTLVDPNISLTEKLTSEGLTIAGFALPGGGYGKISKEALQTYKQANTAGRVLMEGVENQKILNLIQRNYKSGSTFGGGSTLDALKYELKNPGTKIGGKTHSIKAQETISAVRNILKRYGSELNSREVKVLNKISNDLKSAFKKSKK